jgi:hypothetical protein
MFANNGGKRGSLPPVIILSMYQANAISDILGSLGYLSAIGKYPQLIKCDI